MIKIPILAAGDDLLDASKSNREIWPSETFVFLSVNDLADWYGKDHVAAMIDDLPHPTAEQLRAIFKERKT